METTSNNTMQIFTNTELNANIRVVEIDGQPFFVAKDVCDCLDISKYRDALTRLDDDERGAVEVDTLGGKQQMAAVNEFGLYKLILGSRKPEAKKFQRWITHGVIPSIRKTGKYEVKQSREQLIASALLAAHEVIDELNNKVKALLPKATAYDAIMATFDSVSYRDFCNKIRDTFGVKENEIRDYLIEQRLIYKVNDFNGKSSYKPYKETIDRDLMIVKDTFCNDSKVRPCNYFTYKGQQMLIDHFAPTVALDTPA